MRARATGIRVRQHRRSASRIRKRFTPNCRRKVRIRVTDIRLIDEETRRRSHAVEKLVDTTVGRALLSEILPDGPRRSNSSTGRCRRRRFHERHQCLLSQARSQEDGRLCRPADVHGLPPWRRSAGMSIGVNDMVVPESKQDDPVRSPRPRSRRSRTSMHRVS